MSDSSPALVWFRDDLRLADNPALRAALETGGPLICLYIHDEESEGLRPLGGAAKWWLGRSLAALSADIAERGGELIVAKGKAGEIVPRMAQEAGAAFIAWNRRYGAAEIAIDAAIKETLRQDGRRVESFNGHLLYEPWTVRSKAGEPLKVFSPFWRAARALGEPDAPLPKPRQLSAAKLPEAMRRLATTVEALGFEPTKPDWAGGMRSFWTPGEAGAAERVREFLDGPLKGYGENRNRPDFDSTSRISPYLRFGEIGIRQVWQAAQHAVESGASTAPRGDLEKFQSELGWREFSYHLLFHNPDLHRTNFNRKFDAFPWTSDDKALTAWQRGLTGYPMVDAGMRQLWTTGWMHNRVRMIVASFLVKHLLIDWRAGEDWFWDTLCDADPANNAASWQWVAGSGADAAPYYRIFNPILQGMKFDPDGEYVKQWVPELAGLRPDYIHQPWTASRELLLAARVKLGDTYPRPIVDHDKAREKALEALSAMKPTDG